MKKIIAAVLFLCVSAGAYANTDPFFMLDRGAMLLDTELGINFNYHGSDDVKYYQLKETFKYGIDGRWEVGGSLGFARADLDGDKENGLIDPVFLGKYRVSDNLGGQNLILDVSAFLSPGVFDSYLDDDHDGVAKGGTDFGFRGMIGKTASGGTGWDAVSIGGYTELNFIGSTDSTKSATDFIFGGTGKYYLDGLNSIDADLRLSFYGKRVRGEDSDMGIRLLGGYTRKLTDSLDLGGFLAFETHDADGAKTETYLGARLRYTF